jgi:hypothetical protein
MKTVDLIIGLMQILESLVFLLMPAICGMTGWFWIVLCMVAGVTQSIVGTNKVMESLFGNGGLVCELFGRVEDASDEQCSG